MRCPFGILLDTIEEWLSEESSPAPESTPLPTPSKGAVAPTAKFHLSSKSKRRLEGVHPHLVRVVELAIQITDMDFAVLEGIRTPERQAKLIAEGKSWTKNSRHLVGPDGCGHAVDLAAYKDGKISWAEEDYIPIGKAMRAAAMRADIALEWGANVKFGGDWKSVNDMPHFQLPANKKYPG